jgi:UDP-N-acetylmuramoyl-L-alanyl-D-glutamate--2,6-diaminopimelate ligase
MQLGKLLSTLEGEQYNMMNLDIKSIEFDSRQVKPGALFIAVKGEKYDGHDFIDDAIKNGAVALITQKKISRPLPQIVVEDVRVIMSTLAKKFYGDLADLEKIGITGTNGKTTTSFLIHSILENAGRNPGLIGTIYYIGKEKVKAARTTPESLDIFRLMDHFYKSGAEAVVMEVSSHALALQRVDAIRFHVAVFTNLSQDHLDFHRTIDEYKMAKLRIFSLLTDDGVAIFNLDDPVSKSIEFMELKNTFTYGVKNHGDIWAEIIEDSIDGLNVRVFYKNKDYQVNSHLTGDFNIYNILAAFATGIVMDLAIDEIVTGIEKLEGIRGRMERVVDNIFVDYAHTPSAIEHVLRALKKYAEGLLIIVFGCGGDRDRDKRTKMGSIASRLADLTILTSDNPRSESPGDIIKDIEHGMANNNYKVIEDRRAAIKYAISVKRDNDILLVAGKGHEEYQIIGDRIIKFDDAEVIRECFENL